MRLLHHPKPGPLDDFATLSAQLESHDIVAVLFAASWCPMSTPITQLLDHLFREKLLSNNNNHNNNKNNVPNDAAADRRDFAVLYVSSDKDEESFTNYIQPGWQAVPYTSVERTRIKQHFRVCARREMEELEIETREGELPTVLILDGHRQQVLTRSGIQDMKELGQDALDHWKQLQRALNDDTTTSKNE